MSNDTADGDSVSISVGNCDVGDGEGGSDRVVDGASEATISDGDRDGMVVDGDGVGLDTGVPEGCDDIVIKASVDGGLDPILSGGTLGEALTVGLDVGVIILINSGDNAGGIEGAIETKSESESEGEGEGTAVDDGHIVDSDEGVCDDGVSVFGITDGLFCGARVCWYGADA